MRNPLQSTGWLAAENATSASRFVGTCFAFRRNTCLLTAAHCVRQAAPGSLVANLYNDDLHIGRRIREIIVHPSADLAILRIAETDSWPDKFAGDTSIYDWGMPVSAFGFPEDTGRSGMEPTPRYFRGNIQRMFRHVSHQGFTYEAAELSFGAPGGLSGGPVTPNSDYAMTMGVVAENFSSTTYLSTVTEERTGTTTYIEKLHDRINYAIVVRLDPLTEWLDAHVPYPGAGV